MVWYSYDPANNLQTRTDARGNVTTYGYDALNRPLSVSYSLAGGTATTSNVSYTYGTSATGNTLGQIIAVSNGNSTTNYTSFDSLSDVLATSQITAGATYNFSYGYDVSGDLTSETYPSGRVVTTTYDVVKRPTQIAGVKSGTTTNYASSIGYAPHGGLNTMTYANTLVPNRSYTNRLQPAVAWATYGNNPNEFLQIITNNWNTNGTLQNQTIQSGPGVPSSSLTAITQYFTYDNVNRLTSILHNGGGNNQWNFGYDQWGDMWAGIAGGSLPWNNSTPTASTNFSSNNQLNTTSYDASGNQLGIPSVCSNCLTYDAENHQVTYSSNGTSYVYDGAGNRVKKTTGSNSTVFVYDAFGQMAAQYSTVSATAPCSTCYLTWDHLGSTRLVTDQSGNVIARHDFLPFGGEIVSGYAGRSSQYGASDSTNQKFTGQYRDSESALDFFNARNYGSALGRFLSPDPGNAGADPTDPETWNAYAYVQGNPLNATDASGEDIFSIFQDPGFWGDDGVFDPCLGSYDGMGLCAPIVPVFVSPSSGGKSGPLPPRTTSPGSNTPPSTGTSLPPASFPVARIWACHQESACRVCLLAGVTQRVSAGVLHAGRSTSQHHLLRFRRWSSSPAKQALLRQPFRGAPQL